MCPNGGPGSEDDNWSRGRGTKKNYETERLYVMAEPDEWNGTNIVTAIGNRHGFNRSKSTRLAIEFAARHEELLAEEIEDLEEEWYEVVSDE